MSIFTKTDLAALNILERKQKPTAGDPEDRAHEIADALRGTCLSMCAVATEEEMDDTVLLSELDELVFECTKCGWWGDLSELSDDGICRDCAEGDDDDESA